MNEQRTVGIVVFKDAEVLDFCGPYEVFSVAGRGQDPKPYSVKLIGNVPGPILAVNGLSVNPDFTLEDAPPLDILLVPGGIGTRPLMKDEALVPWIQRTADHCELVLSVCTGALLLGVAGLLDGLKTTTHFGAIDLLRRLTPKAEVLENTRFTDNGRIICSAGISAGIDMSFHVLARQHGIAFARETARYMEYDWRPDSALEKEYA